MRTLRLLHLSGRGFDSSQQDRSMFLLTAGFSRAPRVARIASIRVSSAVPRASIPELKVKKGVVRTNTTPERSGSGEVRGYART